MDHEVAEAADKQSQAMTAKGDEADSKWARERREDLWLLTLVGAAINGSRDVSELAQFADRVLQEFDERFREAQPKTEALQIETCGAHGDRIGEANS